MNNDLYKMNVTRINGQTQDLAAYKGKVLLSGSDNDISWNFEKFLVNREGQVVARFAPEMSPEDPKISKAIEKALA